MLLAGGAEMNGHSVKLLTIEPEREGDALRQKEGKT